MPFHLLGGKMILQMNSSSLTVPIPPTFSYVCAGSALAYDLC